MNLKEITYSSRFLSFYYSERFGWFRIFGIGLKWKDISKHGLIFSERNGLRKSLKIGNWLISILK